MNKALSPLDGRYASRLLEHQNYFSEYALMYYRCKMELLYVLALNQTQLFPALSSEEVKRVEQLITDFNESDYLRIKAIEEITKHDVKACEIFLRERTGIENIHLIHFALTSEDANNLAYTFMLKDYMQKVQIPQIEQLLHKLIAIAEQWKTIPFPCRTHGQKASPSTAGKEIAVFIHRITRVLKELKSYQFYGKLGGAVGNYSAMIAAFPQYDWLRFCHEFMQNQGIIPNIATTQIEDHDSWAAYFDYCRRLNNIVLDLNVDCWLYISYELFFEKSKAEEVGSSTMPHKVNPINFENSEGNIILSNALLTAMSDKLCRSRMQRDLSDSTVQRNMGVALGHAYLAIGETIRGLDKLQLNEKNCREELQNSPELLAEPIQTVLKTVGVDDPYTLLKKASRGQKPTKADLDQLVLSLNIPKEVQERCLAFRVEDYIGDAIRICDLVLQEAQTVLKA